MSAPEISTANAAPKTRRCPYCGTQGPKGIYCAGGECRQAFHNLMSKRGRVAMPLALGWRIKRGSGATAKGAFAELCAYLDHCNAEDRLAGRPSMVEYLEASEKLKGGFGWRERR